MSIRRRYIPVLVVVVALLTAALALLPGTIQHAARADTVGTPTPVGAYNCIVDHGGNVTRPAGSAIVIRQGFSEQTLGTLRTFIGAQTSLASVNDAPMFDISDQYSAPVQQPTGDYVTFANVPTGVTLANPGDTMRFTYSIFVNAKVPEVFNPAAAGEPGKPLFNGPGLGFGGTCTVTATS